MTENHTETPKPQENEESPLPAMDQAVYDALSKHSPRFQKVNNDCGELIKQVQSICGKSPGSQGCMALYEKMFECYAQSICPAEYSSLISCMMKTSDPKQCEKEDNLLNACLQSYSEEMTTILKENDVAMPQAPPMAK
eukprot:TRINITY_DN1854_c0_g1_i2.p1 TRINITY_DN1854_c0_g1~~TRINITY_DN1854_c0_g1_i2.p1  ORF type:complete len:138 (-),score=30.68 TRINITY_DN1854_c0_g1_i2:60-473(-)